ncbi:MAG TPA: hypothetical protein VGP62_25640 [Bryobacteraceae bacterium]|nr:hypothetical protein [Bryobacteraceae bacterium]
MRISSVWRRIAWRSGFRGPLLLRRTLALPMVWTGFLYARVRYGLDFRDASPEAAVAHAETAVLLIHGLADTNIYPEHSKILAARNPGSISLWVVPEALAFGVVGEPVERAALFVRDDVGDVFVEPDSVRGFQFAAQFLVVLFLFFVG